MKKLLWLLAMVTVLSGCQFANSENTFMLTKDQQLYALYDTKGNDKTDFIYRDYEKFDDMGYLVSNKDAQVGFISLQGKPIIPCGEYETLTRVDSMFYATKPVEENTEEKEPNILFQVKLFNRANGACAITVSGDVKGTFVVKAGDQSDTLEKKSFNKDASTILGTGAGTFDVKIVGKNVSDKDGNKTKEIVLTGKIKVTKKGKQTTSYLKSVKEKTKEELELEKYSSSALYVLDAEGKVLAEASEELLIKRTGLPIIKTKDEYKVLYKNGEELYKGTDPITFACHSKNGVLLGFDKKAIYYYTSLEDNTVQKELEIECAGDFVCLNSNERYAVFYDENAKKAVITDILNEKYIYIALDIENTYIDKSDNIIIESGSKSYIYDPIDVSLVKLTSFYMNGTTYALKHDNVYGPHNLYKASEVSGEIKDCQIYPAAKLIRYEIFPVYVKDEGYTYYNFEGKNVIETIYKEANPFDDCASAIVRVSDKGYSLINTKGEVLTSEEYALIEYLGQGYYAMYNEVGMYGIIDSVGKVIFPIQFTDMSSTPIVKNDDMFFMIFNKNGRSYVYDMKKEMTELFSAEGDMEYFEEGYFKTTYRYFDIHGEEIK